MDNNITMSSNILGFRRDRLLSLLREKAYEKRDVILASGRHSDFYIDCRRIIMTAEGHSLVGSLLHDLIAITHPETVAVGGLELACPIVSAVSMASFSRSCFSIRQLDAFYVRKGDIEGAGHLSPNSPVAIVEDVVTTGRSSLLAADRAKQAGLRPVGIFAIVDRCEGGREAIEGRLPLISLYQRNDFPA
jgi:orotate phosphoribosyltransferase